MKLKQILENQILVPRRSKEERQKNLATIHYKRIQEYIKNGSKGGLDLKGTPLKILPPNLVKVEGNLDLGSSQIESLGNLEYVGGSLYLSYSQITSLGKLKKVGHYLLLNNTPIKFLDNLKYVGGYLDLSDTPIESLGNLKYVLGSINLENSKVVSLGNLEMIGINLYLRNSPLSKTHTEEQIRQQVEVEGRVFFY